MFAGKFLRCSLSGPGYPMANLCNGNPKENKMSYVHRLVAEAFIPNPKNKRDVNHKNGKKSDNRVENLEWATRPENVVHAFHVLKVRHADVRGEKQPMSKLSDIKIGFIRKWGMRVKHRVLAELLGVHRSTVSKAIKGDTWPHIPQTNP